MTRFVLGATTLQFNCDPVHPASRRVTVRQQREFSTEGEVVVYEKGAAVALHGLDFPRLTAAVADALRDFVERTCRGTRNTFTWYDHADTARTVRLSSSSLPLAPVGGGAFRVSISLEEAL